MDPQDSAPEESKRLNEESREIWDANAEAWDKRIGGGGGWQTIVIAPEAEKLLAIKPGETVLDAACGNGVFSRRLAELGANVVAFDFSAELIRRARARTAEQPELAKRIDYHLADATDEEQVVALSGGEQRFDAAVCNMALMDMPEIRPLFRALARVLRPGGRFVFSLMHPCFNGTGPVMALERPDFRLPPVYTIKLERYLTSEATTGIAIMGQPRDQYYWHRPLGEVLGEGFAAGLVMDAFEEPRIVASGSSTNPIDWVNFDMPPLLFARFRLPAM